MGGENQARRREREGVREEGREDGTVGAVDNSRLGAKTLLLLIDKEKKRKRKQYTVIKKKHKTNTKARKGDMNINVCEHIFSGN